MISRKKTSLIAAAITIFSLSLFFNFNRLKAFADTSSSGSGWLWGGSDDGRGHAHTPANNTGLGWVSMNNTNIAGSTNSYGVNIPSTDGPLSGYAWSENLGWISFNPADLVGCPDGNCTAQRVGNTLTGWARIIGIRDEASIGNSGGWQGWVKLKGLFNKTSTTYSTTYYGLSCGANLYAYCNGTDQYVSCVDTGHGHNHHIAYVYPNGCRSWEGRRNYGSPGCYLTCSHVVASTITTPISYGVTIDPSTNKLSGYAWSDELGWIDFSRASLNICVPSTYTHSCFNGATCGACGSIATTNPWICIKTDNCGAPSTVAQSECQANGVNSCSNTMCPACKPDKNWREVAPN